LTTSNSGKTIKVSKAMPTADMPSNSKTTKKSEKNGFSRGLENANPSGANERAHFRNEIADGQDPKPGCHLGVGDLSLVSFSPVDVHVAVLDLLPRFDM